MQKYLERLTVLADPTGQYQAWIYSHNQGEKFEIKYHTLSDGRKEGVWLQTRYETRTFTNNLDDAHQIAMLKIDDLGRKLPLNRQ